ncbi:DNA methylase [Pseudomonas sp. ZM23]|uniref:DNA methylase n=1 Tax=Pseudomonas triclosanedens TaxID=2961893 RepID=A0ABY6ZYT1_9PSED|nr:DNA methylase [Pseudomonas triclosanedens]MCP8462764.1 DNA methylase [Pseudomonas triclosanedens]MCP8468384.1 DNA methylase [Pseudomonas triclosanedens]MCP8475143.1 DNA methylase [Pseudomonas triclosanedens]WAI49949.1 DNA methylase [Pseudomonas triclosanedens]
MANSPAHRFGQIIGDLLEEIIAPQLQEFCNSRGYYLDKKGSRGKARKGKKVSWLDKYGNSHDLDFVIEKNGSDDEIGRPLAFIEAAWRRYTKHSRNKAQEIQGAVLPIAEKYSWDKPFLGAVLGGVFTLSSINQMASSGFDVVLFPYSSVVAAFASVGIDAEFDEHTPDKVFQAAVERYEALDAAGRAALERDLVTRNQELIDEFFQNLAATLDRQIDSVVIIPLHGKSNEFEEISEAASFVQQYQEQSTQGGPFREYEVIVKYSNGDKIEALFKDKARTAAFLRYVSDGVGV